MFLVCSVISAWCFMFRLFHKNEKIRLLSQPDTVKHGEDLNESQSLDLFHFQHIQHSTHDMTNTNKHTGRIPNRHTSTVPVLLLNTKSTFHHISQAG